MLMPNEPDELDDDTPSAAAPYAYVGPNDAGWKPACKSGVDSDERRNAPLPDGTLSKSAKSANLHSSIDILHVHLATMLHIV